MCCGAVWLRTLIHSGSMINLFGQFIFSPAIIISPKATTRVHITEDSLIWIPLCIYYEL